MPDTNGSPGGRPTSTVEVLRAARALIDTPEKWTQGCYAKDAKGNGLPPEDEDAVCFCASGALRHVDVDVDVCWPAFDALGLAVGGNIIEFNDSHSHADVLAAFDRAIAAEETRVTA